MYSLLQLYLIMKPLSICILLFCVNEFSAAQSLVIIDSLKKELASPKNVNEQMDIYYYLSEEWSESNFDSAIYYARALYDMASRSKNYEYRIYGYRLIGAAFDYQYSQDSARYYYELGLNLAREEQDTLQMGIGYFNLGTLMVLSGKYVQALPYYESALQIYEKIPGSEDRISRLFNNLGLVYRRTGRYQNAIQMYRRSLEIAGEDISGRRLMNLKLNMANAFNSLKEYDSAKIFFEEALNLAVEVDDQLSYYYASTGLGSISGLKGDYEAAIIFLKPIVTDDNINDVPLLISSNSFMGYAYSQLRQFERAEQYFDKAITLANQNNYPEQTKNLYLHLTNHFELKNDFHKAFSYFRKYNELRDELLNAEVIDRTAEWEERFRNQEKEKEIVALRFTNQQAALLAAKRNGERNIFIVSTLFLTLLAIFVGYLYQSRKKANHILTEKNTIINQSLNEKELLMREIHHRVKNNLQVISSLLNMQSNFVEDSKATAAVMESKNRVHSMSLIHQSLYQQDDVTEVNIAEYFEQLLANLENGYHQEDKEIEVISDIESLAVDVDIAIPLGLIVNELVSNAYKHAFINRSKGEIFVKFSKAGDTYSLIISDNGKGNDGKPLVRKKSLGMILINDLSKKLRADVEVNTLEGVKTSLTFPAKLKSV